jgi:hypothetical protein
MDCPRSVFKSGNANETLCRRVDPLFGFSFVESRIFVPTVFYVCGMLMLRLISVQILHRLLYQV